jgi:ATP-dependent 26S proteasome regulatory subunit
LSTIDRELLKPNSSVALHKHSNALVDVLPPEADSSIAMLTAEEKPDVSYSDIGNLIGDHDGEAYFHFGRWDGYSKAGNA